MTSAVAAAVMGGSLIAGAAPASAASSSATQLLDLLVVAPASTSPAYNRDEFQHWIDADGDGCDTRSEVLQQESTTPVTFSSGCTVATGQWQSWYDGTAWTAASDVDIDHFVPLSEAWSSGASAWTADQRRAFANDLDFEPSLEAVTDNVNQSKSDGDPARWLPPLTSAHCDYATDWVEVKYRWNLTVDTSERAALQNILAGPCGSAAIEVPARADIPTPTGNADGAATITAGQQLVGGQSLRSPDGRYVLAFQTDGNLVAYAPGNRVLFSSNTWGFSGAVFKMQPDGNAVIYTSDGRPIWDSGTWRDSGARLTVQDDGNVVLYRTNNTAAWFTGWDRTGLRPGDDLFPGQRIASLNGRYHVTLQRDGNTVVYETRTGRPLYSAGSYGATRLRMQGDGNLVAYYANGAAVFSTNTWREGSSSVNIQDDGNLVIYRADGSPSWFSGWDKGQWAGSPTSGTYLPRPAVYTPPAPQPQPQPSVYYANCDAVRAAGKAPLFAGQPGYEAPRLDRDYDGVACE